MASLYWIINLVCLVIPLLLSFHPKVGLSKEWKPLWTAIILASIPYILWDIYFAEESFWGFNDEYLSGVQLFNLPIEEVVFFFCIPYSCVFTHVVLRKFINNYRLKNETTFTLAFILILISIFLAIQFYDQAYTKYVMFSCALALIFATLTKPKLLSTFYLSFTIMLVPFYFFNGILTGSWIPGEIVWYDESTFSSIRIGTIPLEDFSYAFSMLLLNITLFEIFRTKSRQKT